MSLTGFYNIVRQVLQPFQLYSRLGHIGISHIRRALLNRRNIPIGVQPLSNIQDNKAQRYFQLATIVVAAGAIYPLLYLRQNFELSILDSFSISLSQLSQCYAMLGVTFVLTYLPSGWLADRISPRILLTFSLATTGLVGLWFSTTPSFAELQIIFVSWGVGTGLTFWSAHIKAVTLLANHDEQGRFFGILDGGRGLFEALLATVAIGWFAYSMETQQGSTSEALQ